MNERILEFAKEAGHIYHVGGTVPYFEFSNNQMKKFAELIVQECVGVAHSNADVDETYDYACHTIAWKIKQHFGVD